MGTITSLVEVVIFIVHTQEVTWLIKASPILWRAEVTVSLILNVYKCVLLYVVCLAAFSSLKILN